MHRLTIVVGFALTACASTSSPAPTTPGASSEIDPQFEGAIRAAAPAYLAWGKVDDQPRVAPTLCAAMASPRESSHVRQSAAEYGPHGKKLYYLWATDRAQYRNFELPVGFTIVKESFAAVAGEPLTVGERKDLFVMVKTGPKPGSDEGWIYGTIATDGTVTSAGRVASCMGCHDRDAKHERLFGLAP